MNPTDSLHDVIVPFAVTQDDQCLPRLTTLTLPHLTRLLATWCPQERHHTGPYSLNAPHEWALADALGWSEQADGGLPLAAQAAGRRGVGCAWLHLCQWTVGMEYVSIQPGTGGEWSEDESRALLAALQPLAQEDGLTLIWEKPDRWRAEGEWLAGVAWPSLDRVANRRLDGWLPSPANAPGTATLLRLQNEAQMLFYTHPVNDARLARRLPAVNGFWISGTGQLSDHEPLGPVPHTVTALRSAALQGDWAAWGDAWQAIDTDVIAPLLEASHRGAPARLTLCGEQGWQRWTATPQPVTPVPWWRRLWPRRPAPPVSVAQQMAGL